VNYVTNDTVCIAGCLGTLFLILGCGFLFLY